MLLTNAFSLNMIASFPSNPMCEEISVSEVRDMIGEGFQSAVGHADTASVFSDVLGLHVPMVRSTVSLKKGDVVIIGQYRGPRLTEGTTRLPEGATIQWIKLTVK